MSSYKLGLVVLALGIPLTLVAGCSSDSSSGAAGSGGTAGSGGGAPSAACAEAASEGVRVCVDAVNAAWESCYSENDAPCTSSDSNVAAALSSLETTLQEGCAGGDFLSLSLDSLVFRTPAPRKRTRSPGAPSVVRRARFGRARVTPSRPVWARLIAPPRPWSADP